MPSPTWRGCTLPGVLPHASTLWLQRRGEESPAPQGWCSGAAGARRTSGPASACAATDDFRFLRGAFLQCCPEVRLDCTGSRPQFTWLSAKLHHDIITPSDGVTDRQSPAGFSKPKHFATLTGKKKNLHQPTTLLV